MRRGVCMQRNPAPSMSLCRVRRAPAAASSLVHHLPSLRPNRLQRPWRCSQSSLPPHSRCACRPHQDEDCTRHAQSPQVSRTYPARPTYSPLHRQHNPHDHPRRRRPLQHPPRHSMQRLLGRQEGLPVRSVQGGALLLGNVPARRLAAAQARVRGAEAAPRDVGARVPRQSEGWE